MTRDRDYTRISIPPSRRPHGSHRSGKSVIAPESPRDVVLVKKTQSFPKISAFLIIFTVRCGFLQVPVQWYLSGIYRTPMILILRSPIVCRQTICPLDIPPKRMVIRYSVCYFGRSGAHV